MSEWSSGWKKPRSARWGSARRSASLFTGPAAIPESWSSAMRSLASLSRVHREIRESNSSCHVHRPEQVAKRGSEDQGGLPITLLKAFPLIVAVHGDCDPSVAPEAGITAMGRFRGVGISEGGLNSGVHRVVHECLSEVWEHGLGLTGVDQTPDSPTRDGRAMRRPRRMRH